MSPRSASQFEEMRDSSRRKIMDAAMELFAMQGYHGTSISQIANKVGVTKSLIYNYFKSKSDLMHEIVYDSVEDISGFMTQLQAESSAKGKLATMLRMAFEHLKTKPRLNKLTIGLALQMESFPDLEVFVKGKYTEFMPLITILLQEIGVENPETEAQLIGAIMDGLAVQQVIMGDDLDLDGMQAYLIHKYCGDETE